MKRLNFLLFFIFLSTVSYSQKHKIEHYMYLSDKTSSLDSALYYLNEAEELDYDSIKNPNLYLELQLSKANVYFELGQLSKAEQLFSSNLNVYNPTSKNLFLRLKNRINFSEYKTKQGDLESGRQLIQGVEDSLNALNAQDSLEIYMLYIDSKGINLAYSQKMQEANKVFSIKQTYYKSLLDDFPDSNLIVRRYISVSNSVALTLEHLNKTDKAIIIYHSALALAKEIDDEKNVLTLLANIGRLHFYNGNYEESITLLEPVLHNKSYPTIHLDINVAYANALMGLNKYRLAKIQFLHIKSLNNDINNPYVTVIADGNLGLCYNELDQADSAIFYLNKCIHYFENGQINFENEKIFYAMANSLFKLGDLRQAKKYIDLSEDIILNDSLVKNIHIKHYELKADYYRVSQNYKQAFLASEKYNEKQKLYNSVRKNKEIINLNKKYKVKEQELEYLKLENALLLEQSDKEKEVAKKTKYQIISFVFGIVALLFAYLLRLLIKQKKQISKKTDILKKSNIHLSQLKIELQNSVVKLEDEIKNRKQLMVSYYQHANKKIQMSRPDGVRPKVKTRDIVYIQKLKGGKSVSFFIDSKKVYTKSTFNITQLIENVLSEHIFCRIGKYTIINLHEVKKYSIEKQEVCLKFMVFDEYDGPNRGSDKLEGKYYESEVVLPVESLYLEGFLKRVEVYKSIFM